MSAFISWSAWVAVTAGLVAHWVLVRRRRPREPSELTEQILTNTAANLRKARRELASARAQEDDLVREVSGLALRLKTERARRIVAEDLAQSQAQQLAELRAELASAEVQLARYQCPPAARLMPLPDLPPGWCSFAAGPYRAQFTVFAEAAMPGTSSAAFVSVVASDRQALRAVVEPFTALKAVDSPVQSSPAKECDGQ